MSAANNGGKNKKKKVIKVIVIISIIILIIVYLGVKGAKTASQLYTTEVATVRDITTWNDFTGTIAPVTEKKVAASVSGVKIEQLLIEKGDTVKAGDVIALLDTSAVDQQILEKEASMRITSAQNAASLESALDSYNNMITDMSEGLNASVLQAQSTLDTAYGNLLSAQRAYNDEVKLNNRQLSANILNAMNAVDSTYLAMEASPTDATKASYNQAVRNYEAAKINEESHLTKLFDTLISAQNAYIYAVDNYNSVMRQNQRQLETYELKIRIEQLSSDMTVSDLQLENLKNSLEKYVITAPIDGVVTSLNVTEGELLASAGNIATITDFDELKVDIKIGEYDILGASEGSQVVIIVDAIDKEYDGTIHNVDRVATVSGNVSFFGAEVRFKADDDARSGMSADVRLTTNDLKDVLTISNDAIQSASDGTSYVFVMKDGKMTQQTITCGVSDGKYTQILEGLSEGDTVMYIAYDSFSNMMQQVTEE